MDQWGGLAAGHGANKSKQEGSCRASCLGFFGEVGEHCRSNAYRQAAHKHVGNGRDYKYPHEYETGEQISEEFKHSDSRAGQKKFMPRRCGNHFFCALIVIRYDKAAHPTIKITPPNINVQDIPVTSRIPGYNIL